ncbi:hypothetical protein SteCoe_31396 [Stentor coeruleus]|uniref:Uncharacterized protein n=1 Tax=Stentor coeruleus TaxID=5963 RepID=A0A1R2B1I1_9CILI|nr:hypothetical protein SteCoe_31396 [Stentor coeruleus]
MECILQNQQLQKLDLELIWQSVQNQNDFEFKPNLYSFFTPMITLKTLKTLKIHILIYIFSEVNKLITLMENLEVLKLSIKEDFPTESSSTINNFFKTLQSHQNTLIKKLSIHYHCIQYTGINITKIIKHIEKNKDLKKISLKNISYNLTIEIPNFFRTNLNIKCIKFPNNFYFNKTSAENLCCYLINSLFLEELQVSSTITISSKSFFNAISINQSLRKLVLKHFINNYNRHYEISLEDTQFYFNVVVNSLIEDFSITSYINNTSDFYDNYNKYNLNKNLVDYKFTNFLKSLENSLAKQRNLRKINIIIPNISCEHAGVFGDFIIKNVGLQKIDFFAGYNLRMLMDNKIDVLKIQNSFIPNESHNINAVLYEIFNKLLVGANRIIKITENNYKKSVTDIKSLEKNNILTLNSKKSPKNSNDFSPLHYFSILILSSQIQKLTEINLRYVYLESYSTIFNELLKKFKFLKKIKLRILNKNNHNILLPDIIKTLTSNMKKVSYIKCKFKYICIINTLEIFNDLGNHKALKIFKLKRCRLIGNNLENMLNEFLYKSRLRSLCLCHIIFSCELIAQLAKGLEINETITCLRLEKMIVEVKVEEFKVKVFFKIIKSVELKKNYEVLSIYFLNESKNDFFSCYNEEKTKNEAVEYYLSCVNTMIFNNKNLKEFNVCVKIPDKYFLKYSKMLLNAIKNNKSLKVVNCFDIEEINENKNFIQNILNECCYKKDRIYDYYSIKLMPIVISELIKTSSLSLKNAVVKKLFGNCKCKTLSLTYKKNYTKNYRIYKYNFIEMLKFLEQIIIFDIIFSSVEIKIIEKNIRKLENLHTIKLKNDSIQNYDISPFLEAKTLRSLKISNIIFIEACLSKFTEKIKFLHLETLTLKNINFDQNSKIQTSFVQLIDAITSSTLKVLKIYIKYTENLLKSLIERLYKFSNLECISLSITNNFIRYENSIKMIILLVKNKTLRLNKIKINKYTWDLEKLKQEKCLKAGKGNFCPVDLMILAEICEEKVVDNIESLDLLGNTDIVDSCFVKNILRIIRASKCSEVVLEMLRNRHSNEITSLLQEKESSVIMLIIS